MSEISNAQMAVHLIVFADLTGINNRNRAFISSFYEDMLFLGRFTIFGLEP